MDWPLSTGENQIEHEDDDDDDEHDYELVRPLRILADTDRRRFQVPNDNYIPLLDFIPAIFLARSASYFAYSLLSTSNLLNM